MEYGTPRYSVSRPSMQAWLYEPEVLARIALGTSLTLRVSARRAEKACAYLSDQRCAAARVRAALRAMALRSACVWWANRVRAAFLAMAVRSEALRLRAWRFA